MPRACVCVSKGTAAVCGCGDWCRREGGTTGSGGSGGGGDWAPVTDENREPASTIPAPELVTLYAAAFIRNSNRTHSLTLYYCL